MLSRSVTAIVLLALFVVGVANGVVTLAGHAPIPLCADLPEVGSAPETPELRAAFDRASDAATTRRGPITGVGIGNGHGRVVIDTPAPTEDALRRLTALFGGMPVCIEFAGPFVAFGGGR